ncbi:MAG: deoxyribodipyrimidine photo-lyase, partial [Bacteroides sp.]|nr:deoxyribodipyrimidine photo-lyase [Bacteroides sp.]
YKQRDEIHGQLSAQGSSLHIYTGEPLVVWKELLSRYEVQSVYVNKDYEPYALQRDRQIGELFQRSGISFHDFKDQVIFEEDEILKNDGQPYTVFTPYKRKWLERFKTETPKAAGLTAGGFIQCTGFFPPMETLGFAPSVIKVLPYDLSRLEDYPHMRNFPGPDATSYLSPHLRFGTISIRQLIAGLAPSDEVFLSELIWREFFMQILFHFPKVVTQNFKAKYNGISWRNNEDDFDRWCRGETGYPMVDAGMRQLNETGYMHNRVRMVCASFLCKHLLTDWRMGEAYFARKLLDYELSSNNGNWQWAAGTGCDAAPYFRIFNPQEQLKKFDPDLEYVRRWVPEYGTPEYVSPMLDHKFARNRALEIYKDGLLNYLPEG